MKRKRYYPFIILVVFALIAAACGDDDATTPTPTPTTVAATVAPTDPPPATTTKPGETTPPPAPTTTSTTQPEVGEGDVTIAPDRVQDDETVVIAWRGFYNSLDPPDSLVNFNREASAAMYDRLLTYDLTERGDGTLVWNGLDYGPGLAESWVIDGGSVTFTIRQGVTFNKTGNPLTAEDIKYSFVRSLPVPGFGRFNSSLAGLFEPERQITVIDDHTIRFDYELNDGTPFLLPASLPSMRFPIFGIVDSVEVASHATQDADCQPEDPAREGCDPWGHLWLKENSEGSGPYVIESTTPGTELILNRVQGHWTEGDQSQIGRAYNGFDRVIYRVFNSSADIVALMLGGEVDVAFALGTRELNALAEAGFTVVNAEIPDVWRLDLPVTTPPFDNPLVREAIAHAVPYQTIVDNVFANATRAFSIVNPNSPSFIPEADWPTDLQRARDLLGQAGLADGFEADFYYDSSRQEWADVALFLKASLGAVGIDLNLKPLPATEFATQTTARFSDDTVMAGIQGRSGLIWLDDADPNVGLWLVTRGFPGPVGVGGFSNATHYSNVAVDTLHFENRYNPDLEARTEAYREVQRIVAADIPMVPIAVRGYPGAIHPAITGVAFTADPHLRSYLLRLAG